MGPPMTYRLLLVVQGGARGPAACSRVHMPTRVRGGGEPSGAGPLSRATAPAAPPPGSCSLRVGGAGGARPPGNQGPRPAQPAAAPQRGRREPRQPCREAQPRAGARCRPCPPTRAHPPSPPTKPTHQARPPSPPIGAQKNNNSPHAARRDAPRRTRVAEEDGGAAAHGARVLHPRLLQPRLQRLDALHAWPGERAGGGGGGAVAAQVTGGRRRLGGGAQGKAGPRPGTRTAGPDPPPAPGSGSTPINAHPRRCGGRARRAWGAPPAGRGWAAPGGGGRGARREDRHGRWQVVGGDGFHDIARPRHGARRRAAHAAGCLPVPVHFQAGGPASLPAQAKRRIRSRDNRPANSHPP